MDKLQFKNKYHLEYEPTNNQWDVISGTQNQMCVIAGPGSGKTATMINRVLYLVGEEHVDTSTIFLSTFTRKAAAELKTKIVDAFDRAGLIVDTNSMRIGTLHSLFYEMLCDYGGNKYSGFEIIDEFMHKYKLFSDRGQNSPYRDLWFLRPYSQSGERFDTEEWNRQYWGFAENYLTLYDNVIESEIIESLISPTNEFKNLIKTTLAEANSNFQPEIFMECCCKLGKSIIAHRAQLQNLKFMDYADIQAEMYKLLCEKQIVTQIRHIIIDEYQDTNALQEKLVYELSKNADSLCVVGDDDQSIYRFRGATVENILEFRMLFPDSKIIELYDNFRSQSQIVEFYDEYMREDPMLESAYNWKNARYDKEIVSKGAQKHSMSVIRCGANNADGWCDEVVNLICKLQDSGAVTNLNQICFLAYSITEPSIQKLIKHLKNNNIKVFAPRARMFMVQEEINAVRQCINFCLFSDKQHPTNKEFNDWITHKRNNFIKPSETYLSDMVQELFQFDYFKKILDKTNDLSLAKSMAAGNIGILLDEIIQFETHINHVKVCNIQQARNVANSFFNDYLPRKQKNNLEDFSMEDEKLPDGCVSFMTIHQSKGLEFPVVIVGSLSHTNWAPKRNFTALLTRLIHDIQHQPNSDITESDMIDFDTRRLYYTAFSRAQDLLVLTTSGKTQDIFGNDILDPSPLFKKVYDKCLDYRQVDLGSMSITKVKKNKTFRSYSFTSDIKLYNDCPRKYKFYKKLGFSQGIDTGMLFGTLVHESIECIHNISIEQKRIPAEQEIQEIVHKQYKILKERVGSNLKFPVLRAYNQVINYVNLNRDSVLNVVEAELPLSCLSQGFAIKGVVDAIRSKEGKVDIIDFKTGQLPSYDSILLQTYFKQMQLYKYLVDSETDYMVKEMKLYFPGANNDTGEFIKVPNSENDIKILINEFIAIVRKIEKCEFNALASDKSICNNCCMKYYCNIY